VVSRQGKQYTTQNAVAEAIMNEHSNRDVIVDLSPNNEHSETSEPIEKQPTKRQTA
jgi:hypothetical protein